MDAYALALRHAYQELAALESQKSHLLRLIKTLEVMTDFSPAMLPSTTIGYVSKGITEEIKTVLRESPVHLTAVQVRDAILARGVTTRNVRTLLISVHTILKRIEAEINIDVRGKKRFYKIIAANDQWNHSPTVCA